MVIQHLELRILAAVVVVVELTTQPITVVKMVVQVS
jgi:hypothetical protein